MLAYFVLCCILMCAVYLWSYIGDDARRFARQQRCSYLVVEKPQ